MEKKLESYIVGENGIGYFLGKDDLYYPDLVYGGTNYVIGKYGIIAAKYLKEHRKILYATLLTTEKLNQYLHDIDVECQERIEQFIKEMVKKEGLKESLKNTDPLKWIGLMNNYKSAAEELVLKEIIYDAHSRDDRRNI